MESAFNNCASLIIAGRDNNSHPMVGPSDSYNIPW